MEIKWLRTFLIAAQYENFRQASEVLFLAQPTVTLHIKRVEEEVGTPLFERSGRNVILTAAGRRFLPHTEQVLETFDKGMHDIESWKKGYNHKITLAVSPFIATSILPVIVRRFVNCFPSIEVVVQVMESKYIGEAITGGNADLGLSRVLPVQPELNSKPLSEEPVIIVAPHDGGELESSPPMDLEQLLSDEVLLINNHPEYWEDVLADIRRTYRRMRTMVVSQVHVTKRFIEEGLGFSFLPRSAVKRELIEGRMLEVYTDQIRLPMAHTYLVTKSETNEINAFTAFLYQFYGLDGEHKQTD